MSLQRLTLLLLLALGLLSVPACPTGDDDDATGDDDDATGDDDDTTADDDDTTGDDDDSSPDDDDTGPPDDDDSAPDDDDTGPPDDDDTGPPDDDDTGPPDDDDTGPPDDDDDSGPPPFFINLGALQTSLSHTPGTSPCPQNSGEVTLFNNTPNATTFTATVALSTGGDQMFGFATQAVESGGTAVAEVTGNVPAAGSTTLYVGLIVCTNEADPESGFTITMGAGADVSTSTGTLDVTFN